MARKIWKSPEMRAGRWYAKLTFPDGQIARFGLPPETTTQGQAKKLTAQICAKFESGEYKQPPRSDPKAAPLLAVSQYVLVDVGHRWTKTREKKLAASADSHGHLINHFVPDAPFDIRDINDTHMDAFAESLETRVNEEEITEKTAKNVWGSVQKFFDVGRES